MNLVDVREDLMDLLGSVSANTYVFPPEVVLTPAVICVPDTPYITPMAISTGKYRVKFRLTFATAMANNQAALNTIEEMVFAAYNALINVGYIVGETSDPRPTTLGQSELLTCDIVVEAMVQLEE